jgi:hypothetical protein
MKIGIKTFILPGQEKAMELVMNDPDLVVTICERNFAAKEGVLIVFVQYEDNREEGALI